MQDQVKRITPSPMEDNPYRSPREPDGPMTDLGKFDAEQRAELRFLGGILVVAATAVVALVAASILLTGSLTSG